MGFWAPHKKKQGFTGVITPTYRVITLPITFRGPSCKKFVWILRMRDFVNYWVVWVSDFVTIKKWKCSSAKRRRMYHCITAISLKMDGLQFADQFSLFLPSKNPIFAQILIFFALEKPQKNPKSSSRSWMSKPWRVLSTKPLQRAASQWEWRRPPCMQRRSW